MTPRVRILLVEDQYFARVALHTIIDSRDDMEVVAEGAHGTDAPRLYEKYRPDVTIMDLRLPGLSGFDAIRAIRQIDPEARIVVLSNYEGIEDVHRAMVAGAMGYLTKDADADVLVAAILAVHKGRRYLQKSLAQAQAGRIEDEELTAREYEVIEHLTRGCSNQQIADRLGIAEKTVRIHVSNILAKLRVEDRTQAALAALQRGIVHLD